MTKALLEKVVNKLTDFPVYKLRYLLTIPNMVDALIKTIQRYGIKYNKETHDEVVNLVSIKITGNDVECEWTETEYEVFVLYIENRGKQNELR